MKFEEFELERNQSLFEHEVDFNLSESGLHPLPLKKILTKNEQSDLLNVELVYGHTNGTPTLREKISKLYNGARPENILATSGSAEANFVAIMSLLNPGDELIYMVPNYLQIRGIARNIGVNVIELPLREKLGWQWDINELEAIISDKTKMIAVCHPNNPTGSIFYKNELIKFLNKIKKTTLVVLDAAYCEYIKDNKYDDGMKLVKNYSNLIITRSFSKIFALGGLRIGWGYANSKIISQLYQYKKPFNVSRLSCIAAQESLKNKKWINESIKNNSVNKTLTCKQLNNKSFKIIDTEANFILLKFKNSLITQEFVDFLHLNKITVRSLSSYGLNNFVRMTIGTKTDMKKAILVANKFNV